MLIFYNWGGGEGGSSRGGGGTVAFYRIPRGYILINKEFLKYGQTALPPPSLPHITYHIISY